MTWTELPAGDERRLWISKDARDDRYKRAFTTAQRRDLKQRLSVNDKQLQGLEVALRVVAHYTEAGAGLVEVRAPLRTLAKKAKETAMALESLLKAPATESARSEARLRLLESVDILHPKRAAVDPMKPGSTFFHDYDEREEEAKRIHAIVAELDAIAEHALARMPKAQTHAAAHTHPIWYIHEVLNFGFSSEVPLPRLPFPASSSKTSNFREIVGICYQAAKAPTSDPERAIKAFIKQQRDDSQKKQEA